MFFQLLTGFLLGILIALLAWKAKALSRSGALAAALTGGLIFGLGGLPWAALLLTFFLTSSLLSRLLGRRKSRFNEKFAKGSQRDWGQVAANGGLGALLVILHTWHGEQSWPWIAFCGAMAAVNADTWATELGVFSRRLPRLVTNGRSVERGTSGAVSLEGSLAALAGSALIAVTAALVTHSSHCLSLVAGVTLGGLGAAFFDSLLGATLQAIYYCPACQKETERYPLHLCGTPTQKIRGLAWLNNDVVNFSASLMGAALSYILWINF